MTRAYEEQIKATRAALHLLVKLPVALRWALTVTDEDDPSSPSSLNIYTFGTGDWDYIVRRLGLNTKPTRGGGYTSYYTQSLMVSLIDEEASSE